MRCADICIHKTKLQVMVQSQTNEWHKRRRKTVYHMDHSAMVQHDPAPESAQITQINAQQSARQQVLHQHSNENDTRVQK